MKNTEPRLRGVAHSDAIADYIFDMIAQLAQLARQIDDPYAAIHLEAIIAVRRATAKDRSVA